MTPEERAAETLGAIQGQAGPCLRDDLEDAKGWVVPWIAAAVREAVAGEREACARLAIARAVREDQRADYAIGDELGQATGGREAAKDIATAIRARGEVTPDEARVIFHTETKRA